MLANKSVKSDLIYSNTHASTEVAQVNYTITTTCERRTKPFLDFGHFQKLELLRNEFQHS